jgi:hypothetical protein
VILQKHDNPEAAIIQNQTMLSGMKTRNLWTDQSVALARIAVIARRLALGTSNGILSFRGLQRPPGGSKTSKKSPAEVSYSRKLPARRIVSGQKWAVIYCATVTFARFFLK